MEIWKDIKGYERLYEVSNCGRVRTHIERVVPVKYKGFRKLKQRFLKSQKRHPEYNKVSLYKNGKRTEFYLHRLVAFAFLQEVEGLDQINHIDGNKRNNHIKNLEWSNNQLNTIHAYETGLNKTVGIYLVGLNNDQTLFFTSLTKATRFLGRSKGYINRRIGLGYNYLESSNERVYQYKIIK